MARRTKRWSGEPFAETSRRVAGSALIALLAACSEPRSVTELADDTSGAFDPDSLSYQAILPTDLPPEGTRSLFDHMIKEHGSVPFPFEEMIALLATYDAEGKPPVTVLIPDGRSLLKGQANFHKPRIIVAADPRLPKSDAELGPQLRGRLFLGFVEGAAEIEVISYNVAAGRFEFQLVKDYRDGGSPRLVYAKRAICMTCHAGAAPIFPVRPWEETGGQPAISKAILEARKAQSGARYQGVAIEDTLTSPETIDELTEIGNVLPTLQRVWIDGCGGDAEAGPACRRQMLKLALRYRVRPTEFNAADPEFSRLVEMQKPNWPEGGIALANGDLLNRNPFVDKPRRSLWQWLAEKGTDLFSGPENKSVPFSDAKLSEFEKLPPLRPELDPLTPREPKEILEPGAPTAITALAREFSDNDQRLLESHSNFDLPRLLAAVDHTALDELLGPVPFRRQATMQALLTALGNTQPPVASYISTEGMSDPIVEGVKPIEITEGSVLELYEHYCFGCHRGNPNAKLDFMNGTTEEEVLAQIKETPEIRDALDFERYLGTEKENKLMPPKNSWQRRELDKARAAGEDDVEKMAEAVPGLFDL